MARIKFDFKWDISEDANGGRQLGSSDPRTGWFGVTDAVDNGGTYSCVILAGATNVPMALNNLANVNLLLIKSDQTIVFTKNSTSGEPTTLQALGAGATDALMAMTTTGITSLYISNNGSINANVVISVAGTDPS
jgi:hypothetical protein